MLNMRISYGQSKRTREEEAKRAFSAGSYFLKSRDEHGGLQIPAVTNQVDPAPAQQEKSEKLIGKVTTPSVTLSDIFETLKGNNQAVSTDTDTDTSTSTTESLNPIVDVYRSFVQEEEIATTTPATAAIGVQVTNQHFSAPDVPLAEAILINDATIVTPDGSSANQTVLSCMNPKGTQNHLWLYRKRHETIYGFFYQAGEVTQTQDGNYTFQQQTSKRYGVKSRSTMRVNKSVR